jgi:hypothetical protein
MGILGYWDTEDSTALYPSKTPTYHALHVRSFSYTASCGGGGKSESRVRSRVRS